MGGRERQEAESKKDQRQTPGVPDVIQEADEVVDASQLPSTVLRPDCGGGSAAVGFRTT